MTYPYCIQNDFYGFSGILGVMNDDAILLNLADELCEVLIEVTDDLGADGMGTLAARGPIGQGGEGGDASLDAALGIVVEGNLQDFIGDGFMNAFFKSSWCH